MTEPVPPSSLVALRDRRESTLQLLSDSFAADVLTIEQLDERIARAHAATAVAELDALVADLAPPASSKALVARTPTTIDAALVAPRQRMHSVFGNLERGGDWIVPERLAVTAVFGNAELDFRAARFSAAEVEIDVRVVFGNVELIVPPGLVVECEGTTIFGNVESHASRGAVAEPGRPRLRVRGPVVFGNVEVHARLPGESEREARRRHKRERKQLAGGRRALPAHTADE